MKSVIFTIIMVIISSCNKSDNEQTMIDTSIEMSIKNSNGVDLLNPNTPNYFNENTLSLFYLINGEVIEVNNPNLDYRKGFFIFKHQSEYRIRIFPNTDDKEKNPITYIKFNENPKDTLKCEFVRTNNSLICTKVWFNSELKYDSNVSERYFEIVK